MLKEIGWPHVCLFPSDFSLHEPWINDEEPGQPSMCLGFPLLTLIVPICWLTGGNIKKRRGLPWHNGSLKVCDVMPSAWKGHALGKQCSTIRQDSTTAKMRTSSHVSRRQTIHISYCFSRHLLPSVYSSFHKPMSHVTCF